MDSLISRYRNISILLLAILVQLVLLAYQVKSNQDVRLIRVWAVTAVDADGQGAGVRPQFGGLVSAQLHISAKCSARERAVEAGTEQVETGKPVSENGTRYGGPGSSSGCLSSPDAVADRSCTNYRDGGGCKFQSVFVDRGATAGVTKGMAVVTADGIVGKVVASYITASQVQLITDSGFAAGVVSQKNRVFGTLRGLGYAACRVDYVQNEEKVEAGEWFYTSGDDRVFPRGLPVGRARNRSQWRLVQRYLY